MKDAKLTKKVSRKKPDLSHIAPELRRFVVPIKKLRSDPANVRTHPDRNVQAVMDSLKKFGQQKPIVTGGGGVVVAGSGLLAAAQKLGWKHVAAVRTNLRGKNRRAYAIADNRTSDLSMFDEDSLALQLQELSDCDYDMEAVGFSEDELMELLAESETSSEGENSPPAISKKVQHPGIFFTVGDFKFAVPLTGYRRWLKQIKEKAGTDTPDIVAEIRRRLKLQ